jgi:hypothetical protein
VLGGILAGFYLWRRDLVANMTGHFLVDFVGNVLPRLFSSVSSDKSWVNSERNRPIHVADEIPSACHAL